MPTDPGRSDTDLESDPSTQSVSERQINAEVDSLLVPVAADHGGSQVSHSELTLLGQVIGERYRIVELLGRGGMGAVYRADHVHIKKSFAFKVLHPELTHHVEAVRRFEREAIAAARIDHPNVATAIDFGNLPTGEFYLVLDYVQGRSLRALLEQERTLSEARTVRIARQIASALAAAHSASIVHRDLKPDNVMLVDGTNDPDFVKVLDFGIAKLRSEDIADEPAITRFGTVFGTPEYMSPEQALGQTVDARSDLYSLGIMMYEMLSGATPFVDPQLVTVLSRHMTDAPAPLSDVSPELWAVISHLLEKRPEARPCSAEALTFELDSLHPSRLIATAMGGGPSSRRDALASTDTLLAGDETPQSVARSARERFAPTDTLSVQQFSLPPWLKRQVTVAGRPWPWVLIAVASGLVALSIALTLTVGSMLSPAVPEPSVASASAKAQQAAVQTEQERRISQWITLATQGDKVALRELENRPEPSRSAAEWAAIGAGRTHAKQYSEATQAYGQALTLDARSQVTPQSVRDLYQAALVAESSEASLALAIKYLGAQGADLVYAVYDSIGPNRATKLERKKLRQLLDSPALQRQATEALKVQLSLDNAKSCQDYRVLLARVKTYGDSRAVKSLRKLTYDRGCGLLGLGDCWSCVRGTRALSDALEAAKSRPAPSF